MWKLLKPGASLDDAMSILLLPACLLCPWSRALLQLCCSPVSTLQAASLILLGPRFRAILIAFGDLLRFDICRLECRNAQVRRFCRHSQTWRANFPDISARFLLQLHRTLMRANGHKEPEQRRRRRVQGRCRSAKAKAKAAKRQAVESKKAAAKGGKSGKPRRRLRRSARERVKGIGKGGNQSGGGWHRAAISKYLRGIKHMGRLGDERKNLLQLANAHARRLLEAQDEEFVRTKAAGRAATVSRKHGGVPFLKPATRKVQRVDEDRPGKKRLLADDAEKGVRFAAPWLSNSVAASNEQQHVENLRTISKWACEQPTDVVQPEHFQADPIPVVGDTASMSVKVRELLPPSKALVQSVLDASACEAGRKESLISHWVQAHALLEHRCARGVKLHRPQCDYNKALCRDARCCVCRHGKGSAPALLVNLFKTWFGKGGVGRVAYSEQAAVVAVSRTGMADDAARWFFIGCGHLGKKTFTVQELVRARLDLAATPLPLDPLCCSVAS